MIEELKLKPCPFCGGKADVRTRHDKFTRMYAQCGYCGAKSDEIAAEIYATRIEARNRAAVLWNNRMEENE